jgi:hypothetical protein
MARKILFGSEFAVLDVLWIASMYQMICLHPCDPLLALLTGLLAIGQAPLRGGKSSSLASCRISRPHARSMMPLDNNLEDM